MVRIYPDWIFLNKTEDGEYLYKSPYDDRNYASTKDERFLILEKYIKNILGRTTLLPKLFKVLIEKV